MNGSILPTIDGLVQPYHDPNRAAVRIETLFNLHSALVYWLGKLNHAAKSRGEAQDNIRNQGLPAAVKVSGQWMEARPSCVGGSQWGLVIGMRPGWLPVDRAWWGLGLRNSGSARGFIRGRKAVGGAALARI